ncbi:MAG: 30S ribosomal protein S3 [Candidatus Shikimatogenerans sp. JK-2022]|nr:30S ribosomal protein S3 [Candidatus Shikimatogenerans bostrichidophilus]
MGQKTNPTSNRLGIIHGWKSIWLNDYSINVYEDYLIRKYLENRFFNKYCISNIFIERTRNRIIINVCTSRPAIIIGKKGKEVNFLKKEIKKIIINNRKNIIKKNKYFNIFLNIVDIIKPDIDSLLVAKNICRQIENRISYKRTIKYSILNAMRYKIKGIKIRISGRLNGNEIARSEVYKKGYIKLSTFRSNIDYNFYEANTKYGKIGVKVWIMKNIIYNNKKDLSNYYKENLKINFKKNAKKKI